MANGIGVQETSSIHVSSRPVDVGARTTDASILHADLDAFYASVEQRDNPSLRGKPVIVGGGVVLAASYEAKALGIKTAMGGTMARQLCPDAIVVSPRMHAYTEASKAVFEIFHDTTPLVEGISVDEAFLDVGGLRRIAGTPVEIATRLRARVKAEVGLNITVGVARTKFLAKVASGVGKPDGLLAVPPDGELEFLHPLHVQRLWGVGKVTAEKLERVGVFTVGDVAAMTEEQLVSIAGVAAGHKLHSLAHNVDRRRVTTGKRRSTMGSQRAMGRRRKTHSEIDAELRGIVDRVTRRLRSADRVGRTVVVRFRFDDYSRATRSHTLTEATADTAPIMDSAVRTLADMWPTIERQGLTLIGLSIANLSNADAVQMTLPFADLSALDKAVDHVRDKFGTNSISRAANVGKEQGYAVPMLPDS